MPEQISLMARIEYLVQRIVSSAQSMDWFEVYLKSAITSLVARKAAAQTQDLLYKHVLGL
jgi:hypothetical protein